MSLLTDLFNTLDKRSLGGMADTLGESDQTISRGMQSALGTVLGGMATKSDNPTFLRKMLDMAPSGMGDVSWSSLASSVADPNSSLMSAGKRMLSTLFGGSEGMITRALGTGTGMQPNVISSLLGMAAPMVMSFLGKRVHDEGMSMGGLGPRAGDNGRLARGRSDSRQREVSGTLGGPPAAPGADTWSVLALQPHAQAYDPIAGRYGQPRFA